MKYTFFKKKYRLSTQNGFTLIEILLSVSITAVLMTILVFFMQDILEVQKKQHIIREVHEQGDIMMDTILTSIHDAESVVNPGVGSTGMLLELSSEVLANDPIEISFVTDITYFEKDNNGTTPMHNDDIVTTNIAFTNTTQSGGWDTVNVELTLSANNQSNRAFYDYEKTWYGTATIRNYER